MTGKTIKEDIKIDNTICKCPINKQKPQYFSLDVYCLNCGKIIHKF